MFWPLTVQTSIVLLASQEGPRDYAACFGPRSYINRFISNIDLVQCFIDLEDVVVDTRVVNQKHCMGYLALSYIICNVT
jgi:hypothetical protein